LYCHNAITTYEIMANRETMNHEIPNHEIMIQQIVKFMRSCVYA
jgi:hypothetical protein